MSPTHTLPVRKRNKSSGITVTGRCVCPGYYGRWYQGSQQTQEEGRAALSGPCLCESNRGESWAPSMLSLFIIGSSHPSGGTSFSHHNQPMCSILLKILPFHWAISSFSQSTVITPVALGLLLVSSMSILDLVISMMIWLPSRNCAFLATGHKAILSPDTERVSVSPKELLAPGIDALPYLLLPLAGPEEFDLDVHPPPSLSWFGLQSWVQFQDQEKLLEPLQFLPPTKTRDKDPSIRLTLIETLLLLCHTRWGRDYLRSHGVYEIIRTADQNERVKNVYIYFVLVFVWPVHTFI